MSHVSHTPPKPMRVAVYLADQNPHRDRSLGISVATEVLLRALHKRPSVDLLPVVSKSSIRFDEAKGPQIGLACRTDRALPRLIIDQIHPLLARPNCDLWYYPKGYLPRFFQSDQPRVGTFHDIALPHYQKHYPHLRQGAAYRYWLKQWHNSIRKLDLILAISQHLKDQLINYCGEQGIPAPRVEVTHESSPFESATPATREEKQDYVLHMASAEPHKRTDTLVTQWETWGRTAPVQLKIAGSLTPNLQQRAETCSSIEALGRLPHDQLPECVRRARTVVVSSEIEAFGLPALEAYYLGTPVVYAQGTAVREVLGPQTEHCSFNLDEPETLHPALCHALEMDHEGVLAIRDSLLKRFHSDMIASNVENAFRTVAS